MGFGIGTIIINDELNLQEYYIEKIKEIYWSFGYKSENEELFKAFLKENNWLIE